MLESPLAKALFVGNGVTTEFPFPFKVWEPTQIMVTVQDNVGKYGVVTGWDVELTETGGTVTYLHEGRPLPVGYKLAITRKMPFIQLVDLITGTRWDPAVIEERLDRDCAERQELRELIGRAILFAATEENVPTAEEYIERLREFYDGALKARDEACQCAREAEAALESIPPVVDDALKRIAEAGSFQFDSISENGELQINRVEATGDAQKQRLENIASIILSTHGKSYQELTARLVNPILVDEVYTLPDTYSYIVGRNQVRIHYDGIFLSPTFWEEVGHVDTPSNQIRFKTAFDALQEINIWIGSLDDAEEAAKKSEAAAYRGTVAAERAEATVPLYCTYIENLGRTPPAGVPEGGLVFYKNYIGG